MAENVELQKWRDDFRSLDLPTVRFVVQCADDKICVGNDNFHTMHIIHVRSCSGNGFMPQIRYGGEQDLHLDSNCEVIIGTDSHVYDTAVLVGIKRLNRVIEKFTTALAVARATKN